jgi:hypothetical protein
MSERRNDCDRFERWLLTGGTELESQVWDDHLESCAECREQWHAHRMLAATFALEAAPELSPAFEAGLDRKLASLVEIRPLRGWRQAAMLAYVAGALGLLGWALKGVPLPTIDLSAPWVPVAALVAVPLTFMLAIAASRWIPGRGQPRGLGVLAL